MTTKDKPINVGTVGHVGHGEVDYSTLDAYASLCAVSREVYGFDVKAKPNDHCNWERQFPTINSRFAWIEDDDHFRQRILNKLRG